MKFINTILKKINILTLLIGLPFSVFAQTPITPDDTPIKFAMPILTVAPDARAAGMGDIGAATQPSVSDQAWNCAKYVFNDSKSAVALSYIPWMRNVGSTNINLLYLTGFYKIDNKQAIAASLRYFSLGDLMFIGINNEAIRSSNPNEFAIDVSYSRLLGQYFSIGAAFRYLRSDLAGGYYSQEGNVVLEPANGVAADVGFFFNKPIRMGNMISEVSAGVSITNIGSKMAYAYESGSDKSYFLPTTLRLAGGLKMDLDYYNELAFSLELSKYLVPTPPIYERDSNGAIVYDENGNPIIIAGMDDNVSVPKGMIQSFYDAPGGFSEELREIMLGVGVEYTYSRMFKARVGYFNDPKNAQHRYFTLGAGLVYSMFTLDLSYMLPVVSGFQSPLANTIHITLAVDFGKTQSRRSFERY